MKKSNGTEINLLIERPLIREMNQKYQLSQGGIGGDQNDGKIDSGAVAISD